MIETVCDRCGDDCGKQGTLKLTVEIVRGGQPASTLDFCAACAAAFDGFVKRTPAAPVRAAMPVGDRPKGRRKE